MQNISKTRVLVECALLIAMGTILAQVKIFRMPSGGSVTLLSMVPFIMISLRHGTKWGFLAGLANVVLQISLGGIYTPPAGTIWALIGSILFDYVFAYLVLAFAALFAKPFKKKAAGVAIGTAIVCFLRFICAFISGFLIWGSLTNGLWSAVVYSFGYNIAYLLPESLLTVAAIYILYKKAPGLFCITSH